MSILLKNYYWGENKQTDLVNRIKSIDLTEKQPSSKFDKIVCDWIIEKEFYEQAFKDLTHSFNDIRDQYHNSLNGGWSTGDKINTLISNYALFDSFINGNKIVFDFFREFEDLSNVFIEALIISHGSKENSPKLAKFNNWLIYKILIHGNADNLITYCKRYNVKQLLLEDNLKKNFLSNKLRNLIKTQKVFENKNPFFHDYYKKLLINSIVLSYLTNIEKEEVIGISKQLTNTILINTALYSSLLKYILGFFKSWAAVIPINSFNCLLFSIIENTKLHGQNFFLEVCEILYYKKKKLKVNTIQFNIIIDFCFNQCQKCKERHAVEAIVYIFKCLGNSSQKQIIQEKILNTLNAKFDSKLYYSAAIYDVITPNEDMFKQFTLVSIERNSIRLFNSKKRYYYVDALINLAFKLDISFPEKVKMEIESLDTYYEWLLNLKSFNYNNFDVNWLSDYATKFYFKKFREVPAIKNCLKEYLNNNRDDKITRLYFDLYKK